MKLLDALNMQRATYFPLTKREREVYLEEVRKQVEHYKQLILESIDALHLILIEYKKRNY